MELKYQKRQLFSVALDAFMLEIAELRRSGKSLVTALDIERGETTYALYFYAEQWSDIDSLASELHLGVSVIVYSLMAKFAQRLLDGLTPEQRARMESYREINKDMQTYYEKTLVPEVEQQRQKELELLKAEHKVRSKK